MARANQVPRVCSQSRTGYPWRLRCDYIKGKGQRAKGKGQRAEGTRGSAQEQEASAAGLRKTFDGIAERRARDDADVGAQVPVEARRVDLSRLAERPPDGLLDQILPVGVQPLRDLVDEVEPASPAHEREQPNDRRAAHPHVAVL